MMKRIILAMVAILPGILLFAQLVNDPNVESREVKHFRSIKVSHAFDVYLAQGDEESLAVSAGDKKFVSQIKTEVRDGELYIWHDGGNINNWNTRKMKLKVYISFAQLDQLDISDASHVYSMGTWKDDELKKKLLGSAN
ncbi:MAG: DUF2807 domain-containing protein [Chitinophagaceae bacterium]